MIITRLDLETIRLIKAIYKMAEEEKDSIPTSTFMKMYARTKKHTARTDALEMQKEFNAIRHFNQFMKETYGKDEINRNYFFNEFVLPMITECYQELAHQDSFQVAA